MQDIADLTGTELQIQSTRLSLTSDLHEAFYESYFRGSQNHNWGVKHTDMYACTRRAFF
jgi:hypothetical protein